MTLLRISIYLIAVSSLSVFAYAFWHELTPYEDNQFIKLFEISLITIATMYFLISAIVLSWKLPKQYLTN